MADQDGNHVSSNSNHDKNDSQSWMIPSWPTLATRLLQDGGSSAWHVLDSVMETSTGNANFCKQLNDELDRAELGSKLLPARTKGDVRAETLLTLLQARMIPPDETDTTTTYALSTSSSSVVPVRGDKSLFFTREYRRRPEFAQRHGMLQQLIATVSNTLLVQLSNGIKFDWDLTSVQLAVYPGDGSSGYVRHCDRGQESCRKEPNEEPVTNEMAASSSNAPSSLSPPSPKRSAQSAPQRIVTCVYYLTDDDWDATMDGGCLRLFRDRASDQYMVDVTPYRDRLIVFRSDGVEHQVLPSLRRPRTAITLWFYGTPVLVVPVKQMKLPSEADLPVMTIGLTLGDGSRNNTLPSHETKVASVQASAATEVKMGPPPLSISRPITTVDGQNHSLPSIFVSIASYRDSETVPTIQSLFATALYPARIVVGLVLQLDEPEDAGLWESIQALDCYKTFNIRCIRMEACHALGPCYARALCQSLHRTTEEYVLQIDSHKRFRQNWDDYLIHQLMHTQTRIGHDKVVLTAYPVGYHLPNRIPNEIRGTLLVPWKFDANNGLLRQRGRQLKSLTEEEEKNAHAPLASAIPCLLYAGGFNFAPARVIHDVPYDQSLHHLFFGEELNMAVRLFTHGYDLFAPPETVCYHLWSRAHRPVQHQQPQQHPKSQQQIMIEARKQQSLTVVQQLLAGHADLLGSHCGLGTVRTAAEFAQALQVNFETQTLADGCENGGLAPEHFVTNFTALSPDSLETKLSLLDASVQSMIGGFLGIS
jgi:Glycosyltransferase (GlcNAc)/2OG-Fe(II) oxygenase superfamily